MMKAPKTLRRNLPEAEFIEASHHGSVEGLNHHSESSIKILCSSAPLCRETHKCSLKTAINRP